MSLPQPHHDGSSRFVSPAHPAIGETVRLDVTVPRDFPVASVHVRYLSDAEPRFATATPVHSDEHETVYRAELVMPNPTLNYRFILEGGPSGYAWLNGTGLHLRDVPDAADFRLVSAPEPPAWAKDAVVYQIFPDRFARSAAADQRVLPEWATARGWDEPLLLDTPLHGSEVVYGGDLRGIIEHLDHIVSIGANVVYLTPFFPAQSNHRYDATTFLHVDPILGGDEALVELVDACHARGLKVLGDFTTNHTGVGHEWFQTALADPTSPEHDFYLWDDSELGYAAWLGVPSLPKLNFTSEALFERLFGEQGVIRHWLRAPFNLDGWRVDVANMSGRYREQDNYQRVARAMRAAVDAEGDKYLVAEHGHDLTGDLDGHGWQGAMNYSAFTRPLWTWLRSREDAPQFLGSPLLVPRLGGEAVVETIEEFSSHLPWTALRHSMNLTGSHDTTRLMTLAHGDERLVGAGAGLIFTLPPNPMVCYGDEIGMEGSYGEDGRRPMPWGAPESWNATTLELYKRLGAARAELDALRHGGLRWINAADDVIVFCRETEDQKVLVAVRRDAHGELRVPLALVPGAEAGRAVLGAGVAAEGHQLVITDDGGPVTIWAW